MVDAFEDGAVLVGIDLGDLPALAVEDLGTEAEGAALLDAFLSG